ncbi:23S rRNA (adenine(1618)-N(6))-methyltransferase RlmF [Paraglaciecola aquimarina]|uniref:Ribosomal RNA large subunit methyltransferase F n=1 Tax=Paraglaciecola aquimarina TaxID=1235557 RepID=A0ABU3SXR0_9ALTE|nr:23S rRNA (adenine(1618)-N(6))-methyltransferase RlmF [Paraglaciecola aquimarina]MDU0354783.1 23S rRNA (adenine(1618)-N(6))-methyltransferase RlmF [Paraglaciecola aquimarina]
MTKVDKGLGLHPRNIHKHGYPLEQLVATYPILKPHIVSKPDNSKTINFADANAVKALNAALLAHYYQVPLWDIPTGYLCPPIPGRVDYVHHIADLLTLDNQGQLPKGKQVKGIDIGTGANLVYPILASRSYGWSMLGTDIDPRSVQSAQQIIDGNASLRGHIKLRLQQNSADIFSGIIAPTEKFDFSMCNPPFHRSAADAQAGSQRKTRNLARHAQKRRSTLINKNNNGLNFAGQSNELWCSGGELAFIQRMITQSVEYSQQVRWFTSLVANKKHIAPLSQSLKYVNVAESKIVDMAQGQKVSRFIAWRF